MKINMHDLDEIADSKRYFRSRDWRGPRGAVNYNYIIRAIREIGGKVSIEWSEE